MSANELPCVLTWHGRSGPRSVSDCSLRCGLHFHACSWTVTEFHDTRRIELKTVSRLPNKFQLCMIGVDMVLSITPLTLSVQCQQLWNAVAPGASCFSDSGTKRTVTPLFLNQFFSHFYFLFLCRIK